MPVVLFSVCATGCALAASDEYHDPAAFLRWHPATSADTVALAGTGVFSDQISDVALIRVLGALR